MAVRAPQPEPDEIEPIVWPDLTALDLDRVTVSYDAEIDYLYVHLYGRPLPAVWDPREGGAWLGLRLEAGDETTGEVVGVMVEHFRVRAMHEHPSWRGLIELSGVASHAAPSLPDRRAVLAQFLDEVMALRAA